MVVKQNIAVKVGGTLVTAYSAASSFNTDAIDLSSHKGEWVFQVFRSLSDGTPTCTIQSSLDGTNWDNYDSLMTGFTIPAIKEGSNFLPKYFRVAYTNTGSPTGTITMIFTQVI